MEQILKLKSSLQMERQPINYITIFIVITVSAIIAVIIYIPVIAANHMSFSAFIKNFNWSQLHYESHQ